MSGERFKVERKYRRGMGRCKVCGYKLHPGNTCMVEILKKIYTPGIIHLTNIQSSSFESFPTTRGEGAI
jgi:hypothetical protein